ncbi:helix-turn-helix transcriptional regulator [Sphingomonas populi]|uniref:Helix-turn-helix transcriptional regulator n=1 Tax=Sphingomonas populi TaxID=2484750 RepID=A0A4Q6XTB5_9SPHN|nr:LuxR C-terminal-related transcriptional regulator [Sphingomonas populi]RZF63191.1 helix-turn-helix transcriptional regulator [Sphingomonas populi]
MQLLSQEKIDAVRVTSPGHIKPAAEALHAIAHECGMRVAPAHDLADKRTPVDAEGNMLATSIFGWSDEDRVWWQNSRIALDSPLTTACRFESQPFWANAEGFRTRENNPYLRSIDVANFEQRAMTKAAIVVPVHLPFGQIGAVSFNPIDRTKTDLTDDFNTMSDAFGLYARTFIATYVQIMGAMQALPSGSRLSKREVECLRWAAIGKTDIEISLIMSRSRATVRFHIHNAATKLNAVNRSQTVFKAAQLGYISLHN